MAFNSCVHTGLQFYTLTGLTLSDCQFIQMSQEQQDEATHHAPDRAPFWADTSSQIQARPNSLPAVLVLPCCVLALHELTLKEQHPQYSGSANN